MSNPLSIYTFVPHRHSASYYYRLQVPAQTTADLGLPFRWMVDSDSMNTSQEAKAKAFFEADVVTLYHPFGEGVANNINMAQTILPSKMEDGWKNPPTLVVETDDNLFDVTPYNPAYRTLGIRDGEGKAILPGSVIGTIEDGQKRVLWKDGEDGFNVKQNQSSIETYRKIVQQVDAISCSTPRVREAVEENAKPRRTAVFPNCVRLDHYPQVALERDNKVKILWQGGAAHYEDFYPLRAVLGEITREYPEVHWLIWGQLYPWAMSLIPPERYTFMPWCDYTEYKLRLVTLGHDINLAPLENNRFNRCRSAIKVYESAVLRKPAPTVAQRTGAYADEMKDGDTALLFDTPEEFKAQLCRLIESEKLRQEIGQNAKDWVNENRNAMKAVPRYCAWLERLRQETIRERPHMPDSQWEVFLKDMEEQERQEREAQEKHVTVSPKG